MLYSLTLAEAGHGAHAPDIILIDKALLKELG
jgi:hypothetical protein